LIDWELVDWEIKDTNREITDDKTPPTIVMVVGMLPIYIAFVVFMVWCVKRIIEVYPL